MTSRSMMAVLPLAFLFIVPLGYAQVDDTPFEQMEALYNQLKDKIDALEQHNKAAEGNLKVVTRQLMLQQFNTEEQIRATGQSGIKRVRNLDHGVRPYYVASFVENQFLQMHSHANSRCTMGMGEFTAVLNGVEFRTRHNDYCLRMKSTTSSEYGVLEDVPFPAVPPEVTRKGSVSEQVAELKEFFRAFATKNSTHRDYQKYFRPQMCYLEGAWTLSDQSTIDESFDSDRHHLDANSWMELQEMTRYLAHVGAKDADENGAYLPTTIINIINETIPVIAQWNFKILCHPLKKYVHPDSFRPVIDFKTMLKNKWSFDKYSATRGARFVLSTNDQGEFEEKPQKYSLLDELMEEIPGLDNYKANLTQTLNGELTYPLKTTDNSIPLNTGLYHRGFRSSKKDANNLERRVRGYSDGSIFMAFNSQPKIASIGYKKCRKSKCTYNSAKVSYAIPLEIVYLTPLLEFNPHDIPYMGHFRKDPMGMVAEMGPDGKYSGKLDNPFNGTNSRVYYRTPLEMFNNIADRDPADTVANAIYVRNSTGHSVRVRASGTPIFLPDIPGIGKIRLRYPIAPVYSEGEATWKEMAAMKDVLMNPQKYEYILKDPALNATYFV